MSNCQNFMSAFYCTCVITDTCTYTCIHHSECTGTDDHTHTHTTMCTQDGFFPLFVASQEGHVRIVEMLLQARATVDLQNKVENCCGVPCAVIIVH